MLYRSHRGLLGESMKTVRDLESLDDVYESEGLARFGVKKAMRTEFYCNDDRIGWETYIVICDGWGPTGFSNGELPKHRITAVDPK